MLRSMIPWTERFPRSLTSFERDLPSLMERFFGGDEPWLTMTEGFVPRANVSENENSYEVTVELPGMKPEEFHVDMHEGELWVTGEKKEEKEEKGRTYHRIERRHGEFRRVIPLPTSVNAENIEAKYEGGVLRITLPKVEEAKPRHIEVKAT